VNAVRAVAVSRGAWVQDRLTAVDRLCDETAVQDAVLTAVLAESRYRKRDFH